MVKLKLFFIVTGKRDHSCHPEEGGGEAGREEKKGNGQTGVCHKVFPPVVVEKQNTKNIVMIYFLLNYYSMALC